MISVRIITFLFCFGGVYLLFTGNAEIRLGGETFEAPKIVIRFIGVLFVIFSWYLWNHPEIASNFSRY